MAFDADTAGTQLVALDHEELLVRRGRRSGAYTIVAVHSTALGPAVGGCRMWRYADSAAAARDALRLSRAMTFKNAAAGLSMGGGKGVIIADPGTAPSDERRREMLLDFADTVNALDGRYITAEDVGTSADDMATIATATDHVAGLARELGGSGDPSPFTALGVEAAMRACVERHFGDPELEGRSVAVVGAGHVGSALARRLAAAGARLLLADIDPERRALADELGADWVESSEALRAAVDVLAPCALGGVLDQTTIPLLRAPIVCGAANNQLAHDGLADDLAAHDILYAPDFVANAGGIINIAVELEPTGYDEDEATRRVAAIENTMSVLLDAAELGGTSPLAAAYALARRRLQEAENTPYPTG
ncbi:MAG: leucine dehydrogenase [Thermoleophilales bacterium]|nr:leucine dehydrogenase [Thermoleophilales bacterium]